jgi:hypothetical protein
MTPEEPFTPLNITDEEWIAAGQACCGIDHEQEPRHEELCDDAQFAESSHHPSE